MSSSLLSSGEALCSAFYTTPTSIFTEVRWEVGDRWRRTKRKRAMGTVACLAEVRPRPRAATSLVRCSKLPQVVFSRARRPRALQARALPRRRHPSPAAGAPRKTRACVTGPPGVPPAGSARRSPRGGRHGAALTSSGAGRGSSSQAPRRPPPFCASLAPTAAAPARATATVTFIFLNNSGRKAKAKTAERRAPAERGERGARAGSQRRGLRSRGCTRAAGRRSGGNPVHLRRRSEPGANTSAGRGRGPGRVRAAGGEARRAPSFVRAAYCASVHRGCFPGRPLAPASASGLVAALRGFLASGGGFGLGDQEQASEGVSGGGAEPAGVGLSPSLGMLTGPSAKLAAP